MITRKSLADEIDVIDEAIKAYNDSKREAFDAYRDQMIAAGVGKPNVKAEIDAVKAAIKRRREAAKDRDGLIEKDALIDEVYDEITRAPRATREIIEKFASDGTNYDATSGEILETNPRLIKQVVDGMQTEAGRAALIAAVDILIEQEEAEEATHQRPSINDEPSPEAGPQAEASPAGTGAGTLADREGRLDGEAASSDLPTNSEIDPTEDRSEGQSLGVGADANVGGRHVDGSAVRADTSNTAGGTVSNPPAKPLRPHCLRPDNCGGYGSHECFSCKKAAKAHEHEEEAA